MLQVRVEEADIKLQGVGLKNLLEKYFVAPELRLLPADYWTGYRGFKMILIVRNFVTWHMRLQVVTTLIGYSPLCENAQQGDVSSLNVGPHLKRKRLVFGLTNSFTLQAHCCVVADSLVEQGRAYVMYSSCCT